KRAYCLKTQPATGETYPKSDLFNKALHVLDGDTRAAENTGGYYLLSWKPYIPGANHSHK
ncbi:hypothetical protein M8R74_12770, partial [Enterobacter hormaechei]|uniref:hypothetical protein n=1 Tax=Enterobacter hormaechei TaxID=158836 RepID=UPI001BDF7A75